jgi:hypothetical protein
MHTQVEAGGFFLLSARSPKIASQIFQDDNVPTTPSTMAIADPINWLITC